MRDPHERLKDKGGTKEETIVPRQYCNIIRLSTGNKKTLGKT